MLGFVLAGCGFQLRGEVNLPEAMANTQLQVQDPYSQFARRLEVLLVNSGTRISNSEQATAILEVPVNRVYKEILTVGDNARVREFRVRHEVQFRLLDSEGQEIIPLQRLEQSREISFDEQEILASAREEEFLRKDLADNLARLALRRLETVQPKAP